MRHYLTEQEFRDFILKEHNPYGGALCRDTAEFRLYCEDQDGTLQTIEFCEVWFHYRVFLYTFPLAIDLGLIQENEFDGWETPLHDVWLDITDMCGWKPFIEVESKNDNLF